MARILLVDDHNDLRNMLSEALTAEGHEVECLGTVAAAQRKLLDDQCDLLIADIGLPDGYGTVLAATARQRGTKAILISGDPDHGLIREPHAAHIRKPFGVDEFGRRDSPPIRGR